MYKFFISLIIILSFIGCDKPVVDTWKPVNPIDSQVLADSMEDISEDELKDLYKRYVGIAEYSKNAKKSFQNTLDIEKAFEVFDTNYEWKAGKYSEFDKAKTNFLNSRGYNTGEDGKDIVDQVVDEEKQISRSKVIEDMQTLADGARLALEQKWKKN